MALSQEAVSARIIVVGKDVAATRTLSKLLDLDETLEVLPETEALGAAPIGEARPDVVIFDPIGQHSDAERAQAYVERISPHTKFLALDAVRHLTVAEAIETVKHLGEAGATERRLRVVEASPERRTLAALSERELEVVRLVAEGLSNKEISAKLSLSDKTVKNHISHILAKMNLTARTQVAVHAIRAGLV